MALPPFIQHLEEYDPVFAQEIEKVLNLAMKENSLDPKTRILISLALDAACWASEGVASLARQAREIGVSEQEIADTLRLAYFITSIPTLKTSFNAFPKKD